MPTFRETPPATARTVGSEPGAEEKLRRSDARFGIVFDHAPMGMLLFDGDARVLRANHALCAMLQFREDELIGRTSTELIHPDDQAASVEMRARVMAGEVDLVSVARRATRKDGAVLQVEVRSTVERRSDGTVELIITHVVDVTERRAQEERLRDSEARYRELVEVSQDLIVRLDPAANLTFVNDAWCAKFGLKREQVLGQSVMPRILEADWPVTRETFRRLASPPHRARVEIRQPAVEGLRWLEWEGCAIFDGNQRLSEFQAIGRDITQAHETAAALSASEARYRGLVESQQAVVLRMGLDGGVTYVNEYGGRVLGLKSPDMLGGDILDWVYPADREAVRAAFANELVPPHRAAIESRVYVDGEVRWFKWEGTMIFDERGNPIELQSVGFDVTDRRAQADALRASLVDLRQSEEKLRLLAQRQVVVREEERKRVGFDLHDGVCQELIGIGIMVEALRDRHGAALADGAGELVRIGRYLGEVVEHLRLLAGELRPMLLHDLGLEGSLRSLGVGLATTETSISTTFRGAVPRLDETAEVTVYRIAQEALTNALRHAQARSVRLELTVDPPQLRLVVSDDGCGFDSARRRTTALGLLSMEERAVALGGSLEITSAPNQGTTIMLECPCVEQPTNPAP